MLLNLADDIINSFLIYLMSMDVLNLFPQIHSKTQLYSSWSACEQLRLLLEISARLPKFVVFTDCE